MGKHKPLKIVQISDCHLFAKPGSKLLGMDTDHSLQLVLDLIVKEQPIFDILLATGDLAQDSSVAAYKRLKQQLARFKVPMYWLLGNHDLREPMETALEGNPALKAHSVQTHHWQIIFLDSSVPHKVHGYISDNELAFLDQALSSTPLHQLICLHHNPIPTHSQWLDVHSLQNAEAFFNVVDRYSHVKMVVWGHIHQHQETQRNGVLLASTPSTCVQFAPESEDFKVDRKMPGYRWLELHPDGHITSGVSRIEEIDFEVDYSVKGY